MPDRAHIGLDNPALRGRLRQPQLQRRAQLSRPVEGVSQYAARRPLQRTERVPVVPIVQPQSTTPPPAFQTAPSSQTFDQPQQPVLQQQFASTQKADTNYVSPRHKLSGLQRMLVGMACFIFIVGIVVSVQTLQTNHSAAAQVAALSNHSNSSGDNGDSTAPSTKKPSAADFANYTVAPDLARYIKIPKLGVNARVLQVGTTSTGALGTPSNVFDAAWYKGSAKPGKPGATLIDGHVSSWTTHGVFYGIKTLKAGDTIQLVLGNGKTLNYSVVKTQTYNAKNVDMRAAVTPVQSGKSGLNLITCTGQVIKGTSEFNQRVIVFATLET